MKHIRETLFLSNKWLLMVLLAIPTVYAIGQANKPGADKTERATVKITLVPVSGEGPTSWGQIGGEVTGVEPENCDCRIVIYAHTDTWYVQPTIASPFTRIKADRTWKSATHLGYDYAALLVKSSFKPPATADDLPDVGGDVLAAVTVPAKEK